MDACGANRFWFSYGEEEIIGRGDPPRATASQDYKVVQREIKKDCVEGSPLLNRSEI